MVRQSGTPEVEGNRPETDRVAIWRRKRSKDAFSSIWARSLVDFQKISYDFRSTVLNVIFQELYVLVNIFPQIPHHESHKTQRELPTPTRNG